MATNTLKIRLGAADSMIMFGSVDLGASSGGLEFGYNPTVFNVEIDQSVLPVLPFRTKEEVTLAVALVQVQMNLVALSFATGAPAGTLGANISNPTNVVTVAAGILNGGASTVCPNLTSLVLTGTAATTTYTYQIVPFCSNGDGVPSAATGTDTTSTGPASLSSTTFFTLNHPGNVVGAVGYKIWRSAGGTAQGIIGTVYGNGAFSFVDTGLVAAPGGYTPAVTNPNTPNTDTTPFGGNLNVPYGPFDFSILKNDGTNNHLRGHLRLVHSGKSIKLAFDRTKNTMLDKLELLCLADLTQPLGSQAGTFTEEY